MRGGIPPLGGLFGYEEASRPGLSVVASAQRLWRLAYAHRRLHALAVYALPRSPEWEVKCALVLHVWLDAEHAAALEARVNELRHPSVDTGTAPDAGLTLAFDERAHARDTAELLAGGYLVARGALVAGLEDYLATANPLADHPSVRVGEAALRDARRRARTRSPTSGCARWTCPSGWRRSSRSRPTSRSSARASSAASCGTRRATR